MTEDVRFWTWEAESSNGGVEVLDIGVVEVSSSLRFDLDEVPFSSTQLVKEKRKIKDPQIHKLEPTTKKQTLKTKIP